VRIPVPHVLFVVMLCGVVTSADAMGTRPPPSPSVGAGGGVKPKPVSGTPDPLLPFQWVLKNTGQSIYPTQIRRGIDLRVFPVYRMGITGKGVKVMVVDDGLDTHHEDLVANIDPTMVRSLVPGTVDPDEVDPNSSDVGKFRRGEHGTAMTGIIGAVANNGVGGQGVAPGVTLGAVRLGTELATAPPLELLKQAHGGAPFSRDVDIFNGSYGFQPQRPSLAEFNADAEVQALAPLLAMRNGKGAISIRAAGNSFLSEENADCEEAGDAGLTCVSAEFYPVALSPQAVMVGSINATGERSVVSNTGANLLVAGPGGDFGFIDQGVLRLGLISTDVSGCERGTSSNTPEKVFGKGFDTLGDASTFTFLSDFERPGTVLFQALNPKCNYSSTAGGTSAATATVTGVVALMLEANPDLTWRDVRAILARTSRRVDAARPATRIALANGDSYVAERRWSRNGAGLWFHNWYGFGLVDATAAVRAAQGWHQHLSGPMADTGWLGRTRGVARTPDATAPDDTAPDNTPDRAPIEIPAGTAGGSSPIRVERPGLVEFVQVEVAFDGLTTSDAAIELYSPSGTRSVLLTPRSMKSTSTGVQIMLASNAFFSERMDGDWTLRLVDARASKPDGDQSNKTPRLLGWSIRLMGS
jgi:subtilisin family serine protease